MTGDASDGHSGVPGLGPAAAKLICAHATTAEGALRWAGRAHEPGRTEAILLQHAETLRLYETLARQRTDGMLSRPAPG